MNADSIAASRTARVLSSAALVWLALVSSAHASFHLMQIEQVIGGVNGDTSAQAVQLRLRSGGQNLVNGLKLVAYDAAGNNPITLATFSHSVGGGASGARILIASASFASHEASPISADFTIANTIPASYFAAGRLAYQSGTDILWSVSWGGSSYTGPDTGTQDNDNDGHFGPAFAAPLPSTSTTALRFTGAASAKSTNNAADYALTPGATFTNNSGNSTTLIAPTPTPTPTPTATPTPSPTPPLPRIAKGPIRIELQQVASGLTAPIDLLSADDGSGRLFIVRQTGQILILKNGQVSATPFLDLSSRLITIRTRYDERGLLGLAFHPGFANPASVGFRKLYTYTSEPVAGAADFTVPNSVAFDHQSVLAEWQVSAGNPDVVDLTSRREVMRIDEPQFNHNGGKLAFRKSDKYFYISLGDGGAADDVGNGHDPATGNAQNLGNILGKILRIDPIDPVLTATSADPVSANGKYRVPVSNPFIASATEPPAVSPLPKAVEIFAYGFRNPFRFSFDLATDKFFVGDVGQNNIEEVDLVESGKNYGWHQKEGSFLFNSTDGTISPDPSPNPAFVEPIAEYSHLDGEAVIGGFVYHGTAAPALAGKYVFGDLSTVASEGEGGAPTGRLFYLDGPKFGTIKELIIGNDDRKLSLFLKGIGEDNSASASAPTGINGDVYLLADSVIAPSGAGGVVLKIVSVPAVPSLINLSTRLKVGTSDNVLIGGFIVTGSSSKKIMLRGIGPSLTANAQPVPGRLANPTLTLFDGGGTSLASNDDWTNSPQQQQIIDSGIAPKDPKESAIIATLQPGNYTAIVSGVGNTTGVGLVEVYDLEQSMPANLVNISTRGAVQTGDDVMIGGFIVGGAAGSNSRVLVRAIGPSLTASGLAGALQNPTLELHDASGATVATNDNWRSSQEAEIIATSIAPSDDRESAILSNLAPGNYTAIIRGVGNTTGVALAEAYQLATPAAAAAKQDPQQ